MLVAAIQHNIVWTNRQANFVALEVLTAKAAENGARLIVLSEMFSTGFVVDDLSIAEPEGGPSSDFLANQAKKFGVWVAGSCPELSPQDNDKRPFNTLVVASPAGECTRYRKIHPFSYGNEDDHFRPGSELVTVEIEGVRCSLFVCYDLRFTTEFWRLATTTDAYIIPANWPASRIDHWTALLKARAIENQAYVIGCNRVGVGGNLSYNGQSRIFSPTGDTLAEGGDTEQILYAEVSAKVVSEVRAQFPFLQDRND